MDLNFDKEMDAILRKARESEFAFAANGSQSHLDPDEMSAFAENALPETAKQFYTAHLANCDMCRKKLSNLILLSAAAESEDIRVEETAEISQVIPWYRKLFAFPNLAYTLGVVVLVFSGIIGFTIMQNVKNSQTLQISQSSERPNDTEEISAAPAEMNSANISNMTAANSNATSFNSSSSVMSNSSMNRAVTNSNTTPAAGKPIASPGAAPKIETRREDDSALSKDERKMQLDGISAGSLSEQRPEEKKETEMNAENADAAKPAPAPPAMTQPTVTDNRLKTVSRSTTAKNRSVTSVETTTVGSKTFNRRNNVWYDAAYSGQTTINITRGTDEYRKLDKDLRTIVENLGGTIVIVRKEKAYRIQ